MGGKVAKGAALGGHAEYGNVAAFLEREVRASNNIVLRLGEAASASTVAALAPKIVLVATGATPVPLEVAGDGSVPVAAGFETLASSLAEKHVLLSDEDGYWWGAQAAEEVVNRGGTLTYRHAFLRAVPGDAHGVTDRCLASPRRTGSDGAGAASDQIACRHAASFFSTMRAGARCRIENVDVIHRHWPSTTE